MEHKLSLIVCNRLLKNGVITEDMKDIYEMRALLEGLCAGKAVMNVNDDIIAELEEIVELINDL